MARSELLIALALCAGCDVVVGISGDQRPCGTASFQPKGKAITAAEDFSIDWDQKTAVMMKDGLSYEYSFATAMATPIDLGIYVNTGLALAPEGNGLFFTAAIEPPTLIGAALEQSMWRTGQRVPKGAYAGTPTADTLGPRRALVRLRDGLPTVQEFEDQAGVWVAIGEPHDLPGVMAPNLTPNGLTLVYAGGTDTPGIFQATRTSLDQWFGAPALVLAGDHMHPQLLGRCSNLYVVDDDAQLTRYDR
jgi:hypothetical protein